MASESIPATPGAWVQTESLLLFRHIMDLGSQLRREIASRVDLSETELRALEHIGGHELGPGEIARLLDVSTAASTGIVDRLEAKGHVERHPHPDDRRRTQVTMTPHARGEVYRHLGGMFTGLAQADAALTDAERDVVVRYLTAAIGAVESALHGQPAPAPEE
jgi:DNA-binding MarR family transcriptional regulator